LALRILERVLGEYNIDRKRVYVTGLSQGGFGTWNISLLRPALFAAMIPIAGGGDPTQMGKLVNKPIWAFHAEDDPVIPVTYSRNSINALRQMGGHPM
jgi:predicted peptidase